MVSADYGDAVWQYTFDDRGNPTRIAQGDAVMEFVYDGQDRLVERWGSDGGAIRYEYDHRGNAVKIVTDTGTVVQETTQEFDLLDRLVRIVGPNGDATRFAYDAVGNLAEKRFPNGVRELFTYDLENDLLSREVVDGDGALLDRMVFGRDRLGNVTKVVELTGRIREFEYDAKLQLVRERIVEADGAEFVITYEYDAVGNRVRKHDSRHGMTEYTYDSNDRLIGKQGAEVASFEYDDNGQLVSRVSEGVTSTYVWNGRERLVEFSQIHADGRGVVQDRQVFFAYDDDGLQISRQVDGEETFFLFDVTRKFAQSLVEYDSSGTVLVSYHYAGSVPIGETQDSQTLFCHPDHVGSVVLATDDLGQIAWANSPDAFGVPGSGDRLNTSLGYTGECRDADAGLVYLRARYLDTADGRFISPDPFAGNFDDPVSLHRYLYAANSPNLFTDPSGEQSLAETLTTVGIYGGLAAAGIAVAQQILGLGETVDWSGQSLSVTYNPTAGMKAGTINTKLIGSGRLGASAAGPGKISVGFGVDYGSAVGGQLNRFTTNNGLNQESNAWNGNYVGMSLTLLANVGFGISRGADAGISVGAFDVQLPRFFVEDLRYFQSLGLSGPYLLIDGSFSLKNVGATAWSFLQMGLARGNASGISVNVGNERSAGLTVTGGITMPLGDTSIKGLFE